MTEVAAGSPPWHAIPVTEAAQRLEVDARKGLSAAEAARRLEQDGPNRLAEARREPLWKAFLRQFKDLLIVILRGAVISLLVTREWETPVVIALVVLLNATIGFVQESRAEASLEALKKMLGDHGSGAPGRAGG
jgi:Ca2+-transporting ATPase